MWFKNSFFVYNILYSGCENGMVLKTWPVQPPASHGFGLVWSGELDRNLVEPESDRVNRTVQPSFLFSFLLAAAIPASKRSVLQTNPPSRRPSSSSRSAAPMPPNSDLYCVAPAPATGRQASWRRRAPPPHTENHSLPQLHPPAARLSTADKLVKLKS